MTAKLSKLSGLGVSSLGVLSLGLAASLASPGFASSGFAAAFGAAGAGLASVGLASALSSLFAAPSPEGAPAGLASAGFASADGSFGASLPACFGDSEGLLPGGDALSVAGAAPDVLSPSARTGSAEYSGKSKTEKISAAAGFPSVPRSNGRFDINEVLSLEAGAFTLLARRRGFRQLCVA
jgi:hypothetical protein